MALRAVTEHPKFAALKALIGAPKGVALGWLESVWHFTGRFTPHGNLGKYADQQIEAWVEWNGAPGALVAALVETGWIDRSAEHRLLVHDWAQHADNATKLAVKRSGKPFCAHTVEMVLPQCGDTVEEAETPCGLPGPGAGAGPVPEPEPEKNTAPDGAAAPRPVLTMSALAKCKPHRPELTAIIQRVFDRYITLTGKNPRQYGLGEDRLAQALKRAEERLKVHGGDLAAVEADLLKAVENMASDEWHQTSGQLEWKFVFRNKSDFETKLTMKPKLGKSDAPKRKYNLEDLCGTVSGL